MKLLQEKRESSLNYQFYLFGSFLDSDSPKDLDLLILHKKSNESTSYSVINFKKELEYNFKKKCTLQLDIVVLNFEEEREMEFLKQVKNQKI